MSARARRPDDDFSRPHSTLAVIGFALAVIAAVAALAAGPGYRREAWDLGTAFTILKWAAYGGLAAAVVSLVGAVATRVGTRSRGIGLAMVGIVIGLVTAYVPWQWRQLAEEVPPIHDITTDTEEPPAFEAILPLRADAPNPSEYEGDSIARLQREAYPDVEPLVLDVPPDEAFLAALEAARETGWEIHAQQPPGDGDAGRIEATDTTFWFGFEDDVVVRVRPADEGSRIDVRSVSRVGRSDVGTNAERIRQYLTKIREAPGVS
ncbi:MAG: DUF1499 domain-containing protein [Gemmatimonadota bacterium]|nr:DUF1499 domain-containing protein [Gemmatimonadota bacterium]